MDHTEAGNPLRELLEIETSRTGIKKSEYEPSFDNKFGYVYRSIAHGLRDIIEDEKFNQNEKLNKALTHIQNLVDVGKEIECSCPPQKKDTDTGHLVW